MKNVILFSALLLSILVGSAKAQIAHGDLKKWSPVEVWWFGPDHHEMDSKPNPFLDYRLSVRFTSPSLVYYDVPGYFDGNGVGGNSGPIWKSIIAPDEVGTWTAVASFRAAPGVATSLDPDAGSPLSPDGAGMQFDVAPADVSSGALERGRLEYVGGHYLKYRDGGYFLKGGVGSPENLFAFAGFDDTHGGNYGLHFYFQHQQDWNAGDPNFSSNVNGVDGKCLIGALNYLASQRVNSVYFLPMNLGGDGNDTHPWVFGGDPLHFDLSKLSQWRQVFDHGAELGFRFDLVLAETESPNENYLDGGTLGVERKLFYRELVARFAHVPAIKWNLSEENDYSHSELVEFAGYIAAQDAYNHPITAHNHPGDLFSLYGSLAGDPLFSATAVQFQPDDAGDVVESLRSMSAGAGQPWSVEMDENMPFDVGLQPWNADDLRKRCLWDVLFSGGTGVDWYMGGDDQSLEEFYSREAMWDFMGIARGFMERHLPFNEMQPADGLLSGESGSFGGGEVFAKPAHVYAVYLPDASPSGTINLGAGDRWRFSKRWWNPRTGEFEGALEVVIGGGLHALGAPPSSPGEDWVVLLRRQAP